MQKGLSTALLWSPISRLPGEIVVADLSTPAHLGLLCLVIQLFGKLLVSTWIYTLKKFPGPFSVEVSSP